jgi:hypothetical protein
LIERTELAAGAAATSRAAVIATAKKDDEENFMLRIWEDDEAIWKMCCKDIGTMADCDWPLYPNASALERISITPIAVRYLENDTECQSPLLFGRITKIASITV